MACFLSLFGGKKTPRFWVWVSFFVPETLRITLWFCWGIESKPIVWTEKKSLAKTQSNKTHPAAKKLGVDEFMLFPWRGVGIGVFPLKLILKHSLSEWFLCQASLLAAAHIKRRVPGRKARDLCASLAAEWYVARCSKQATTSPPCFRNEYLPGDSAIWRSPTTFERVTEPSQKAMLVYYLEDGPPWLVSGSGCGSGPFRMAILGWKNTGVSNPFANWDDPPSRTQMTLALIGISTLFLEGFQK